MIQLRSKSLLCIFALACCFNLMAAVGQEKKKPDTPGRFGFGWNTQASGIYLPAQTRLGESPLTVELWAKANEKDQSHVFISHGMQTSGDFWEIGSRRESGKLYCRFAATNESEFDTDVVVADGNWHYIAAIWSRDSIKLFVDDQVVFNQAFLPSNQPVHTAGLSLGTRTDERKLTQMLLDDVRISDLARDIVAAPDLPLQRDANTLHLWNFEESREDYLARWTPGGETNQPNLPYPHQIAKYELATEDDWRDGRWQDTIKGPIVSHSFLIDGHPMGAKLTAVFLTDKTTLVFDTKDCGFTAALADSQMRVNPARFGLLSKPKIEGKVVWHVPARKTWMKKDPEAVNPSEYVPIEPKEIDYQRLNLCGNETVFHYKVAGVEIAEHATLVDDDAGKKWILRRWQILPSSKELYLTLAEGFKMEQANHAEENTQQGLEEISGTISRTISGTKGETSLTWSLHGKAADSAGLAARGNDVVLVIKPSESVRTIQLSIAQTDAADGNEEPGTGPVAKYFAQLLSIDELTKPGERRWGDPLKTAGQLAAHDGNVSYLIDELTVPFDNPFQALFFISGFDFFPDGDAAICTAHGDVWRVSGIDGDLKNLQWQRFATGLYQPLGLSIWNGEVVVICRDQLVRLEDTNQNGEADIYHALNHDLHTLGGDHAYAMRLEQDRTGNFYFLKSSEGPPHGASLLRWNRESKVLEVVASGFRHPYGLGIGPNDQLTVADNEGNWVPSSKIDWIEPGKFYGYFEFSDKAPDDAKPARPLCFIPKFLDNSSGGQVWVPKDRRWGDYHSGELLHLSWGRCSLHAVLRQKVGEIWQAATVRFPDLVFRSGSGTGQFNPVDGQLYIVGLDGWQTGAVQDGCFSRVRYTGRTPLMPDSFEVYPNGIKIHFACELDQDVASDVSRYNLEHWNYLWSSTYGSFHYRPSASNEIGHDPIQVQAVTQLDPKTIFVHTEPLQLVDQIQLTANLLSSDGRKFSEPIVGTINALPDFYDIADPITASKYTPKPNLDPNPEGVASQSPAVMRLESSTRAIPRDLFSQKNLVAWCVVPFDAAKRGPKERAEMLSKLGFKHLAYDWRDEHIPTWDDEVLALQNAGVSLTAFWAPASTARPLEEPHWKKILELIDRHQLKMQLWVMLNEGLLQNVPAADRVSMAAGCLTQLAKELERRGCQLALYNHGGWSGHPDNLVAIVKQLRDGNQHNTGIAYNLHHAHGELAELERHLKAMQPYLFCLNLNGMRASGSKILPIGAGDNDKAILEMIQRSGYSGLIGILDHREELDAAQALQENLDGLRKLTQ
jgi:sugar phosphate isomerase/epimerase